MRVMRMGFVTVVVIGHALVILAAFVLASLVRFGSSSSSRWSEILASPLLALVGFVVLALVAFNASGLYRFDERWTLKAEMRDSAKAVAILAGITLMLLYLFKLGQVSRLFLAGFFVFIWLGITFTTMGVHAFYSRRRSTGRGVRHVLIVGTNPAVLPLIGDLAHNHPELGVRIVGYLGREQGLIEKTTYLGSTSMLTEVLARMVVDEVLMAPHGADLEHLDDLVQMATEQGKTVRIPLPTMGQAIQAGTVETVDNIPMLTVSPTSTRHIAMGAKRLVDLFAAAVGLVILSPVFLITALVIRLREGDPVLFRQTRVGIHGREFQLVKFRSMVNNAEELRHALLSRNERSGPVFKISDDPRTTPTGRFIRKTSIDELPQLWNVLTGQMSLVGPRPPLPDEVDRYDPWHMRRLSMKPGITGLWQVSQRANEDFDSWVEADLEYIDNWSPLLDSKIIAATVPAVLRATGS